MFLDDGQERLGSAARPELLGPDRPTHCEAEDHQTPDGVPYDPRLSTLGLAKRTYSALEKHGILTLGDLTELDYSDLMRLKGFGRTALDDVQSLLIRLDLRL